VISTWRAAAQFVDGARAQTTFAIGLALAQAALLVPIALLVRRVFDSDVPRHAEGAIVGFGLTIAACYVLSAALGAIGRAHAARVAKVALGRTRRRLVAQLETLPLSWHDRQAPGSLHAIVVYDCDRVDRMVYNAVSFVLPAVAALVGLGVVAVVLNPILFATMAIFVPAMIVSTRRFANRHEQRLRTWHRTAEAYSTHTQTLLGALATIRAAGAQQRDLERFDAETEGFVAAGYAATVAGSQHQAIQGAMGAVAGVAVLIVGGVLVSRGDLSLGGLFAFYAVVALMLRQLSTALSAVPIVLEGAVAFGRVRALAEATEPDAYRGSERVDFQGAIALDGVTFSYGERPVLAGVELRIGAGEQVCVVGANGAGKTTLMALMLGLYRPQRGTVRADGMPLDRLDLDHLRGQIGVVLQDAVLFAGSVRDNLTLGRPDADDAEIEEALRAATADDVLSTLRDGLHAVLGDGGTGLSGGERQRIAIARAVLAKPRLLLLDEPTAHLSADVSARVVANLSGLAWRPTVVVITHDERVAARVTRTVRVQDGSLVEAG
jgi:ABC-type bacteriocin/lantibiotic exporter with double-glycine peptidase domain